MREIKFRAWVPRINKMEPVISLDWFSEEGFCNKPDVVTNSAQVRDNLILMQYTGLKDKNGVEIYEGDIIKTEWGNDKKETNFKIVYDRGSFFFSPPVRTSEIWPCHLFHKDNENLEVIGNIYENPELFG